MCYVVGFECWEIVCENENSVSGLYNMVSFCVVSVLCMEILSVGILCQGYFIL
jgi:hypothetical protein